MTMHFLKGFESLILLRTSNVVASMPHLRSESGSAAPLVRLMDHKKDVIAEAPLHPPTHIHPKSAQREILHLKGAVTLKLQSRRKSEVKHNQNSEYL